MAMSSAPISSLAEETTQGYDYAVARYMFDLGIWARVTIGAMAAVAALLVLSPTTAFGLVATAVVAGSAGTSVFRSLQDRVAAALAEKKEADTKNDARQLAAKVDEMAKAFEVLKTKVIQASSSPPGETKLNFVQGSALDLGDLTRVETLLYEARGVHERIQR